MSEYKSWITDFPGRCGDLLKQFEKTAKFRNREVTLLFAVASASIAIPYDRMREPSKNADPHPMRNRNDDAQSRIRFDELLKKKVGLLDFWPERNDADISYGKLGSVEGSPDMWSELENPNAMKGEKQFGTLIHHLRNALAHGNIHTRGNPITEIIFLKKRCSGDAENPAKYNFLILTPSKFRDVVMFWTKKLSDLNLEPEVIGKLMIQSDQNPEEAA